MGQDDGAGRFTLPDGTHIGQVGLRVGSLDTILPFYRKVLGLSVERGDDQATVGVEDDPLLLLDEDSDAPQRLAEEAGLYHVAIKLPTRRALANALEHIRASEATLSGAADHIVSEALYLRDPEGNGIELYRDRPRSTWTETADGGVVIDTKPLELEDLASASEAIEGSYHVPPGTEVGHIHLEVTDLDAAESFYVDGLGLQLMARFGTQASFLAAGGYHHHIGLNTWNERRHPRGTGRGLTWFTVSLPDPAALEDAHRNLTTAGYDVEERRQSIVVSDPDGIQIRLTVS